MKIFVLVLTGLMARAADPVLLKTGPELFASYSSILSISEKDPDVYQLYLQNVGRLPKQGLPAELSNNVVLGAMELGGMFCQKALTYEQTIPAGQRNVFPHVDFAADPSQFDDYHANQFIQDLGAAFWQRDVTNDEKSTLVKAISSGASGGTAQLAQIMCTIFATSLPTLVR